MRVIIWVIGTLITGMLSVIVSDWWWKICFLFATWISFSVLNSILMEKEHILQWIKRSREYIVSEEERGEWEQERKRWKTIIADRPICARSHMDDLETEEGLLGSPAVSQTSPGFQLPTR